MMIRRITHNWVSVEQENGRYKRVEFIKNDNSKTAWKALVDFVNSLSDDSIFTRKEIHHAVYPQEIADEFLRRRSVTTIDSYRALLCKTPYVERTDRPGEYRKIQHIPKEATMSKLRKFAGCKDYKKWFIPFEEWIK